MESVDFLASCTSIYSIGRARKKLLLSCSNPRPDSCLGKISRRACSFLDESLAWVLTEVALLRIYNMCMQQPADFRHFTEVCEVDSHVSRRFPTIHLKNRRTFTLFTSWTQELVVNWPKVRTNWPQGSDFGLKTWTRSISFASDRFGSGSFKAMNGNLYCIFSTKE